MTDRSKADTQCTKLARDRSVAALSDSIVPTRRPDGSMLSASGGLPNVLTRLKLETAPAHRRLESDLGLSRETVSEPRIRRLLERFHGFYRVWEPWVASSGLDETFFGPRRKLAFVETDLRAWA